MSKSIDDFIGKKFHRLTAIKFIGRDQSRGQVWKFLCDCGKITKTRRNSVTAGYTKSCGCLNFETKYKKHGKCGTRIYSIWENMIQRCINVRAPSFYRYGGRGIKVCKSWRRFENFYKDMGDPPPGYSLDRINNLGNYEHKNCKWSNPREQANNRRTNKFISAFGQRMTIANWARSLKIHPCTIINRLKSGWKPEEALSCDR